MLSFVAGEAFAWGWDSPIGGNSYYLYNVNQEKFLSTNAGLSDIPVLWQYTGTQDGFILISGNVQFYISGTGSSHRISTTTPSDGGWFGIGNTKGLDGEYAMKWKQDSETGKCALRGVKGSGSKFIKSTSNSTLELTNTDSYEWYFISEAQYNAYKESTFEDWSSLTWTSQEGVTVNAQKDFFGKYKDAYEAFLWGGTKTGKYLETNISNIEDGLYTIEFYASASSTSSRDNEGATPIANPYGNTTYASVHVNNAQVSIPAYNTLYSLGSANVLYTLENVQVENGNINFYINIDKANVNWVATRVVTVKKTGEIARLSCKADKYSTFVAPFDVTLPEGVSAFTLVNVDGSSINLSPYPSGELPANTPVIIKNGDAENPATATYYGVDAGNHVDQPAAGKASLVGQYSSEGTVPTGAYVLQTQGNVQGFYKVGSAAVSRVANRCYLSVPETSTSVKAFSLGDDTDAIEAIKALTSDDAVIYDINGRKLNGLRKGINIVNGHKIMVK